MHVNHEYLLSFIRSNSTERTRSLDYGCGNAEVISAGRAEGLDISGVEAFYEGGNTREKVHELGFLGEVVRELNDNIIDFPDDCFNLIVNNQVLEHAEDLGIVLGEMNRVLKPTGQILSIFPSREVLREGHCGIPLLHKFPKGSRLRIYYAFFLRSLGLGKFKGTKTSMEWAQDFSDWLDSYTFYRPKDELMQSFGKYFENIRFLEHEFVLFRLNFFRSRFLGFYERAIDMRSMGRLSQIVVQRLGSMVFTAEKR